MTHVTYGGSTMAYEYDTLEREDRGSAFLTGLFAGTVLGAGLGLLFAPKTGRELRTQLSDQSGKLQRSASDGYRNASDKVNRMVERGRDAYTRARGAVGGTSQEAGRRGSELAEETGEAVSDTLSEAQRSVKRVP